ncbi:MAG: PKD domain-containing protein [Phycisphaerae bacterium]
MLSPNRFDVLEPRRLFAAFAPDASFSAGGFAMSDFENRADAAFAVALSGGKTLVAGSSGGDFALARYNADGSLDASFGVGGVVRTDFGSDADEAYAIAVQPDGRIVLAGQTRTAANFYDFAVARYNVDGTLDGSFGAGGKAVVAFGNDYDQATAVVVTPDGKILVAGSATESFVSVFAVARLNANGSLDASFGTGGKAVAGFDDAYAGAAAMAVQADGAIVLAGYASDFATGAGDAALVRYTTDGVLDGSFGAGGKVLVDFGTMDDAGRAVAVDALGRIVLAGYARDPGADASDFAAARLLANGTLDAGFGDAGVVVLDLGGTQDQAYAVALDADGHLLLSGRVAAAAGGGTDLTVLRLTDAGALDDEFVPGGVLRMDTGRADDSATGMVVAADGSVTVVGPGAFASPDADFVVARFAIPSLNLAPVVSLTGPSAAVRTFAVSLAGLFTDDGPAGTHELSWDFGDGTTTAYAPASAGLLAPSHTYATSGVYTVTLRVRDAQGAEGVATLSVTVSAAGLVTDALTGQTTLLVAGTDGRDCIDVKRYKKTGKVVLTVGGTVQGVFQADALIVHAGAGRDIVHVHEQVTLRVEIDGGDGHDRLFAGGGPTTLRGGAGNDLLHAGRGASLLDGGDGDDVLVVPSCNRSANTLLGGAGNDHLHGGRGADVLDGGFGNDHYSCVGKNDTVVDVDLKAKKKGN